MVAKVDNIDTSDFVLKTKYNTDKTELENKIPDISNLATKSALTLLKVKYQILVVLLKNQTITQKLLILKRKLLTIIMTNILILQSLIN